MVLYLNVGAVKESREGYKGEFGRRKRKGKMLSLYNNLKNKVSAVESF